LIPTFDDYISIALATRDEISRQWCAHPEIYFCGSSLLESSDYLALPMRRDSSDWIGVLLDAASALLDKGFTMAYVILDDHPPVGRCHDEFLNKMLPEILESRNLTTVSLFGSNQGHRIEGDVFLHDGVFLERLPTSFPWKFSLHPGLWSLDSLVVLLGWLDRSLSDLTDRSAWQFERVGSSIPDVPGSKDLGRHCYRVTSPLSVASRFHQKGVHVLRSMGMFLRTLAGVFWGSKGWTRVSEKFDFINHYYYGPYPLFWRGVMVQGTPNIQFQMFCRLFNKPRLLRLFIDKHRC